MVAGLPTWAFINLIVIDVIIFVCLLWGRRLIP